MQLLWPRLNVIIYSQVIEYNRLKEEAGKLSSRYLQELDSVSRDQKSDQDRRDNEGRKKAEIDGKIKQKRAELEEAHKRLDKLNDYIRYFFSLCFLLIIYINIHRFF